ncbi:superinfection immunity protein [Cellulomonas palmilytica]|uniref:superinfection immunity protein n=1 Tax=Cellulomonas palmilytica TaxID=2608402 RepID=UPI001F2D923D|nr:superinfection immunity protein [Cellulomonas palmilytica]UJP40691.1 superinfection immunity protein [Cellulomonas palmilytica]
MSGTDGDRYFDGHERRYDEPATSPYGTPAAGGGTPAYGTPPASGLDLPPTAQYPAVSSYPSGPNPAASSYPAGSSHPAGSSSPTVSAYPAYDVTPYDDVPQAHVVRPGVAPYAPGAWPATITDRVTPSTAGIVVSWLLAAFTGFYMLPFAIAMTRGKAARWGIFWVTLLLGWTFAGWVGALVWSCLPHRVLSAAPGAAGYAVPPGWYPTPDGRRAYWDGARWTGHVA